MSSRGRWIVLLEGKDFSSWLGTLRSPTWCKYNTTRLHSTTRVSLKFLVCCVVRSVRLGLCVNVLHCQRRWYCISTKRDTQCPKCWENELTFRLGREGIQYPLDRNTERSWQDWQRIRAVWPTRVREPEKAIIISLVCERKDSVPRTWEALEKDWEKVCRRCRGRFDWQKEERRRRPWDHQ